MNTARSAEMDRCIEVCQSCHEICMESIAHCMSLGGKHAAPEHIQMLMDCADICITDARFMMRNSPMHHEVCAACAAVCEACAKSCEALSDESQMQLCADQCRRCAELCRQMSKSHAH